MPNLSFGPETLAALRRAGVKLFFDTHLMLSRPDQFVEAFVKAGADRISIHIEPVYDVIGTLMQIRELKCHAGIVLNPGTPVSAIEALLTQVDLVLVMTVQPGFGGQAFRRDQVAKIAQIHALREARNLRFRIEVDGGIDLENAAECRAAGADAFVAGTSFFKAAGPGRPSRRDHRGAIAARPYLEPALATASTSAYCRRKDAGQLPRQPHLVDLVRRGQGLRDRAGRPVVAPVRHVLEDRERPGMRGLRRRADGSPGLSQLVVRVRRT